MRSRIGACLLTAALLLGACGGDDDDTTSNITVPTEDPAATTSTTETTTTTTEDPKAAVEAALKAKWDAYVRLGGAPDPAHPLIEQVFTGKAREALVDAISRLNLEGAGVRLPEDESRFEVRVTEVRLIDQSTAVVFECTLDGLVVYDLETGEVRDDSVDLAANRNELLLVDGVWKVAEITDLRPEDPQCDGV